ncbi:MAG: hypothetical protein CGU28_09960 [Candidatus Dactylopiibacterium carminicum]|uniref:DUF945 domain-containing protein n=1 Tax=Candidatus Dactylopiibacterium carminicum TaxID=857335 RepID=A0A272ER94_9RHOO|nr:DUF945 family protein [Candidatus Dactylopiibacterium carminicum]KAF7598714.1 DUF945 domain-containing protein [Candidatus Dactylopiibacterium carminicum]PAS92625.1 MAG: hypothetical protein CGU29_10700 [Candidatus Dactylopiibacterium carminicum]PAS96115.1 MAG: hypothetical protein CGU28_09960 [Candidatus Dactylopiibacterium carminicum]PAS98733.1 MAG: hypothetical protein BSR46_11630 [Candidatus Dactylopiibacterium carminicum]
MESQGITAEVSLHRETGPYRLLARAPGLSFSLGENRRLTMTELRMQARGERLPQEGSEIQPGEVHIALDTLSLSDESSPERAFDLGKLHYQVDLAVTGDFLDLNARIGAQTLRTGDQEHGPADYDFSASHLNIPALLQIRERYRALQDDPQMATQPFAVLGAVGEPLQQLLQQQPVFKVDRLAFQTADGQTQASARLAMGALDPAASGNLLAMLGRLELQAELKLPEALALSLADRRGAFPEEDAGVARMRMLAQRTQLQRLVDQGYLVREDGLLHTRVEMRQGAIMLNGKPLGGNS